MSSDAGSHRRRPRAGDPDIAPERGGRSRRSAEPVGLDRVRSDEDGPDGAPRAADGAGDDAAGAADGPPGSTRRGRLRRRPATPRKKAPWWELPVLVVVAVVVAILVKTFLIQPFYIPSASMETTLHGCPGCSGDRVIVNKPVYTVVRDPHPGDVVVFKAPDGWNDEVTATSSSSNPVVRGVRWFGQLVGVVPPDEEDLIKRVVAIGGQTVKCCDAQGNVQVSDDGPNGTFHSLDDASFVYEEPGLEQFGQLAFGPVTVPKGRLWVMGDHRNDSKDSRYHCGDQPTATSVVCGDGSAATAESSTVPVDLVIGKAVLIAWPPSRWTTLGTPKTFGSVPLPDAAGSLAGLAGLATIGPGGLGLVAAGGVGTVLRRRRRTGSRLRRFGRVRRSRRAPPA